MINKFEEILNEGMDEVKYYLIQHLKSRVDVRNTLGFCDNELLIYFLTEVMLPKEEYEIAAVIVSILDERCALVDSD